MSDTSLIPIETLKAAEVFAPGGVDGLIAKVETDARTLSKDIDGSTPNGRDDLKSLAYKVTRSKTALDEMGKDFVAELKREAGKVDVERRKLRERLDELHDEIRKPVDEFEAREEARIAAHVANLEALLALDQFAGFGPSLLSIDEIESRIVTAEGYAGLDWEEFKDRADQLLARIPSALQARHAALIKQEADRAELENLRKAEADRAEAERLVNAEREQKERDDRIAKDAAAEANRRAEAAELKATLSAAQARSQSIRDQEAAIEAERQRIADIAAQEAVETARREANKSHRAKINREAVADLVRIAGLKEDQAKAVVIAIAQDKIRNLEIRY